MHYVICYDLENDRLREKVAKRLQSHGCNRVQKSVFVAADMTPKQLDLLKNAVTRLMHAGQPAPQDSVLFIPLPDECAKTTLAVGGPNNVLAAIAGLPLKMLL